MGFERSDPTWWADPFEKEVFRLADDALRRALVAGDWSSSRRRPATRYARKPLVSAPELRSGFAHLEVLVPPNVSLDEVKAAVARRWPEVQTVQRSSPGFAGKPSRRSRPHPLPPRAAAPVVLYLRGRGYERIATELSKKDEVATHYTADQVRSVCERAMSRYPWLADVRAAFTVARRRKPKAGK